MALTITFQAGAPCAGGNHFPVTVTPSPGAPIVLHMSRTELRTALDAEERARFAGLLLRVLISQMTGSTAAQIKAAIEAKIVDLTVTG